MSVRHLYRLELYGDRYSTYYNIVWRKQHHTLYITLMYTTEEPMSEYCTSILLLDALTEKFHDAYLWTRRWTDRRRLAALEPHKNYGCNVLYFSLAWSLVIVHRKNVKNYSRRRQNENMNGRNNGKNSDTIWFHKSSSSRTESNMISVEQRCIRNA